ncbi:GyrI-like domain-containing protein [Cognatishimia sp. SS12]|uniref:GyrI-like domain-containing protein n=1 Tax=Cognatishimia sp. SS12 TaxID=2979465 RepID=UPI00232CED40|nr:GyrI-like domain-containing protein [Cognatishimia sp. SS12]MDC0738091.1 GyrI-like domain-containing protein [Cognatishimia sp. SS12]
MNIEKKNFETQHYMYIAGESPMNDGEAIAQSMGAAFAQAFAALGSAGITATSPPITVYTEMPGEKMTFRCGFFVSADDADKATEAAACASIPAGDALYAQHVGPFSDLNQTHGAIWAHAKASGLASAMPVWEIYLDDPNEVEPEALRTEVFHRLG